MQWLAVKAGLDNEKAIGYTTIFQNSNHKRDAWVRQDRPGSFKHRGEMLALFGRQDPHFGLYGLLRSVRVSGVYWSAFGGRQHIDARRSRTHAFNYTLR